MKVTNSREFHPIYRCQRVILLNVSKLSALIVKMFCPLYFSVCVKAG